MAKTKWKCPSCTEYMTQDGLVFVEEGEWDGKAYQQEGECVVVKCACGMRMAVIDLPRSGFVGYVPGLDQDISMEAEAAEGDDEDTHLFTHREVW